MTRTYTDAGTLGYMAPEQAYGRARLASDVFSLGLIAYDLLAGVLPTRPFEWPFPQHRRFEAKVPAPVQPVLRKAMAFDPRRRYPDAVAFHTALERAWRRHEEEPERRAARRKRARRPKPPAPSPLAVQADAAPWHRHEVEYVPQKVVAKSAAPGSCGCTMKAVQT